MRIPPALVALSIALGCTASGGPAPSPPAASAPRAAPAPRPATPPAVAAEAQRITATDLAALVESLAGDEARGRMTGTPEAHAAAERIAAALAAAGVQPAGDGGGFLQTIDVAGFELDRPPRLALVAPDGTVTEAVHGADFTYLRGPASTGQFAVVVARQASDIPRPPRSNGALLLLADGRTASRWLQEAGALEAPGWGVIISAGPKSAGAADDAPPRGLLSGQERNEAGEGPTRLRLRGPLLQRATDAGLSAVRLEMDAAELTPAVNVVGVLKGVGTAERPELAQQAIVITAHYDHLGVASSAENARRPPAAAGAADTAPETPDLIYNGADDDASGVAMVLELADAFGHGPPPARTLVFLLVTGEEIGLLGTTYYLDHPVVPLDQTLANVNFEMVGRPDALAGGPGRLWLTGYELTTLGPSWTAAGLAIAPDARPEQNFYQRSDNIAFVHREIIGQTLSSFDLHADYHTVADEPDTLDYGHMEAAARTAYAACRLLVDGALEPRWVEAEPAAEPGAPAAPDQPPAR